MKRTRRAPVPESRTHARTHARTPARTHARRSPARHARTSKLHARRPVPHSRKLARKAHQPGHFDQTALLLGSALLVVHGDVDLDDLVVGRFDVDPGALEAACLLRTF